MDKNIDIVDELRGHEGNAHRDGFVCARCRGADEIERLREQIWQYEHDLVLPGSSDELKRLRELIKTMTRTQP